MIAKITAAYVRHYRDNGQTTAYVEFIDGRGCPGRVEGKWPQEICPHCGGVVRGSHMAALLARAAREGITVTQEVW